LTAVLMLAQWAITAHHVPDMLDELVIVARGISGMLLVTCSIGILYLALEPYVRRQWPETLVSWTRLLAGRYRDSMVARDLLVGGAAGCAVSVIAPFAWAYLLPLTGVPSPRPFSSDDPLLGGRYAAATLLPSVVALFTTSMLPSFPAGPNLGHWSANPMLIGLAVAAAIVAYGFRVSRAGEARAVPAS